MATPAAAIIPLLASFAPAFTAPAFRNACPLIAGVLLASGRRALRAVLRARGWMRCYPPRRARGPKASGDPSRRRESKAQPEGAVGRSRDPVAAGDAT